MYVVMLFFLFLYRMILRFLQLKTHIFTDERVVFMKIFVSIINYDEFVKRYTRLVLLILYLF